MPYSPSASSEAGMVSILSVTDKQYGDIVNFWGKEREKKVGEHNNRQQQEPDINQLLKVRREKLSELQANGKDPFVITKYDVTRAFI